MYFQEDVSVTKSNDSDNVISDVEDVIEFGKDATEAFDDIFVRSDIEEQYELVIANADKETITTPQLIALRTAIAVGIQVQQSDSVTALGIDKESVIIVPSSALMYDMEGLKDFIKKGWDKFKAMLIAANVMFKKVFVKILNLLSFRKGTIEKLIEKVESTSTLNSKFKPTLAAKAGFVNYLNNVSSYDVNLNGYDRVLNFAISDDLMDGLKTITTLLEKRVIYFTKLYIKNGQVDKDANIKYFSTITKGLKSIGEFSKVFNSTTVSNISKDDSVIIAGMNGDSCKGIHVKSNGTVRKINIKIFGEIKTLSNVTSKNLISLLKSAENINDDFKSMVDDAFSIVDDVMNVADSMDAVILNVLAIPEDKKKSFNVDKKAVKNTITLLPWLAFNTTLAVYREIGFVIELSKAAVTSKD